MVLLVSFSCRGLSLEPCLGRKVAGCSGRINLQMPTKFQKETILQARWFSSSCCRETTRFVSSSRPSTSSFNSRLSYSMSQLWSFPHPAHTSRLAPGFKYPMRRLYQHMALPPESEGGEAKKRPNLKDSSLSSQKKLKSTTVTLSAPATPASKPPSPSPPPNSSPTPHPSDTIPTNAQQRRTDWGIIKRLMSNVWPRNDWKTRLTVLGGFGLLVSAKVGLSHSFRREYGQSENLDFIF